MSNTVTFRSDQDAGRGGGDLWYTLTVVHHPEPRFLGARRPLPVGATVLLGRGADCFGAGVLEDGRISRSHARVTIAAGGGRVEDAGSRNGTQLNGEVVTSAGLHEGDVIGLGQVLLLFHKTPPVVRPPEHTTLIGRSHLIGRVVEDIAKVAPHPASVLVLGETGTGKELVARAIHGGSGRRGRMSAVNCGGMPDTLLQSELFGHVRGAYSGADRERTGLLEAASGGTLFLDEIGDASPTLQVALLRFLQEGEVRRLGANTTVKVDTRIVAATHQPLDQMVADGTFREDLLARLSRWVIRVPALRERREDIPHLVRFFLDRAGATGVIPHHRLALRLVRHGWPRNVRELEMVVERALIEASGASPLPLTPGVDEALGGSGILRSTGEIPLPGRTTGEITVQPAANPSRTPHDRPSVEEMRALLAKHRGNVRQVSLALGAARNTLYRWFQEMELDPKDFR